LKAVVYTDGRHDNPRYNVISARSVIHQSAASNAGGPAHGCAVLVPPYHFAERNFWALALIAFSLAPFGGLLFCIFIPPALPNWRALHPPNLRNAPNRSGRSARAGFAAARGMVFALSLFGGYRTASPPSQPQLSKRGHVIYARDDTVAEGAHASAGAGPSDAAPESNRSDRSEKPL
jgi:hypothetical protein